MSFLASGPAFGQESQDELIEEIVVTGSMLRSPNQDASSPIMTVELGDIQQNGQVSLILSLNQLPQFNATSGVFSGGQGTGGGRTVNLRGLGSNRNLVLFDGRRLPLADINGNVDINLIPEVAVGNLDVITGGASAVYGSDAMSGVVNFRSVPYFDGIKVDAQYGDSGEGDVPQSSVSFALSSSFADDRGQILLAANTTDRNGLYGDKRSFFEFVTPSSYLGTSTYVPSADNLPDQDVLDALFAGYGFPGADVPNSQRYGFNDNGTLFLQNGGTNYQGPTTNGYAVLGGNVRMPVGQQFLIVQPIDRTTGFAKFDYELTPRITLFGQLMAVRSNVYTESGGSLTQFGNLTTIPATNPFIPADLQTLLDSRDDPTAPFVWNGRYTGIHWKGWDELYNTSQYLLGAKGDLSGEWSYEVYASVDKTDHNQTMRHAVLKSRVQTLLNAADGGDSICEGGFNPFGIVNTSSISDECVNYISVDAHSQELLSQDTLQATFQGPLFALPAGDVRLAIQANYRQHDYEYTPNAALASQDIEAVIASAPAVGDVDVTELATQVEVPIAETVLLGAAYRYSDYSTVGGVNAFNADLKWRPSDTMLLRAGYQRAVRAPNIGELFSAAQGVQVPFGTPPGALGDPCDIRSIARTGAGGDSVRQLCIDQGIPVNIVDTYIFPTTATAGVQSGNPDLDVEKADTYNIGVNWASESSSPLWSSLSMSVDYYSIEIKDVISVVPGLTTLSKCYNLDGTNPSYSNSNSFCQLLSRDASGALDLIRTPYLNLGSLETDGVDVEVRWAPELSAFGLDSAGSLFVNTNIAYTSTFKIQTVPGEPTQDFANTISVGNSHPRWKAMTSIGYLGESLTVGLRWHFLGSMDDATSVTTPSAPRPGTPTYNKFDLFSNYAISDRWSVRAGISNLTDEKSVRVSSSQWSTDLSVYDPVGLAYYIGMRFSM